MMDGFFYKSAKICKVKIFDAWDFFPEFFLLWKKMMMILLSFIRFDVDNYVEKT